MPHLDATALTDDPQGMKFLSAVLAEPACEQPYVKTIAVPDASLDMSAAEVAEIVRPVARRVSVKSRRRVPEAA